MIYDFLKSLDRKDLERLAALKLSMVEAARDLSDWYDQHHLKEESLNYHTTAYVESFDYERACKRLEDIREERRIK